MQKKIVVDNSSHSTFWRFAEDNLQLQLGVQSYISIHGYAITRHTAVIMHCQQGYSVSCLMKHIQLFAQALIHTVCLLKFSHFINTSHYEKPQIHMVSGRSVGLLLAKMHSGKLLKNFTVNRLMKLSQFPKFGRSCSGCSHTCWSSTYTHKIAQARRKRQNTISPTSAFEVGQYILILKPRFLMSSGGKTIHVFQLKQPMQSNLVTEQTK